MNGVAWREWMAMTMTGTTHDSAALESELVAGRFSLMRGGPTNTVLGRILRLAPGTFPAMVVAGLLLMATFVPPILLAWLDRSLLGSEVTIPLSQDWYVIARFVFALPVLVLGANFADVLLRNAFQQCWLGGVVGAAAKPDFLAALARVARWRDARLPELLCLVLAIVPAAFPFFGADAQGAPPIAGPTWDRDADGGLTRAGAWIELVSAPVFRFVVLLWLWRFLLWMWLLAGFSRMDLDLRASHPDGACGLSFLGLAQCRFVVLSVVGAMLVCGYCLNQMTHAGESVHDLRFLIAGYVVGAPLLLMAPLVLLTAKMARTKRESLHLYAGLGHQAAAAFEAEWLAARAGDKQDASRFLASPSPSALADFNGVYGQIQGCSILPLTRWNLISMVLATAAPFIPIAFFAMSIDELAQRIFQILL